MKNIKDKIYTIRGIQVMLDSDLAEIYGYSTKAFNQQVKNNIERFDEDFMFQLSDEEVKDLRSKILTTNISSMSRSNPYVFTEQGIYMLMTVLKGELAVSQSKMLVRLFKQMKDYIVENQQVIGQRDFIRLSLQAAENSQSIAEFKQKLYDIDNKVQNVVSNLGKKVRKSELSPIMFSLGKNETPVGTGNKHHDRFIVLDYKTTDEKMYLSGASSKDAGKKISSISKMLDPNLFHPVIDELLKNPALVL